MQTLLIGLGVAVLFLFLPRYLGRQGGPYPPGPKGIPIVGNVLQIPKQQEWLGYKDWARQSSMVLSHVLPICSSLLLCQLQEFCISISLVPQ